jgi:hypothetical protein
MGTVGRQLPPAGHAVSKLVSDADKALCTRSEFSVGRDPQSGSRVRWRRLDAPAGDGQSLSPRLGHPPGPTQRRVINHQGDLIPGTQGQSQCQMGSDTSLDAARVEQEGHGPSIPAWQRQTQKRVVNLFACTKQANLAHVEWLISRGIQPEFDAQQIRRHMLAER